MADTPGGPASVGARGGAGGPQRRRLLNSGADRLERALATSRIEIEARVDAAVSRGTAPSVPWITAAREHLAEAEDAFAGPRFSVDRGFDSLLAANRKTVSGLDDPQLEQWAAVLRAEAPTKLSSWRLSAVLGLLDRAFPLPPAVGGQAREPRVIPREERYAALELALAIRDEGSQNEYRRITLLRRNLYVLAAIVFVILALIVGLAASEPLELGLDAPGGGTTGKTEWSDLAYVLLFGLLGGTVSAARPLRPRAGNRVPQQLADWHFAVTRPLLGAAGALAAYAFLAAGVLPLEDRSTAIVLAVAFAAGFTERLVLRAVETVVGRERPADDKG